MYAEYMSDLTPITPPSDVVAAAEVGLAKPKVPSRARRSGVPAATETPLAAPTEAPTAIEAPASAVEASVPKAAKPDKRAERIQKKIDRIDAIPHARLVAEDKVKRDRLQAELEGLQGAEKVKSKKPVEKKVSKVKKEPAIAKASTDAKAQDSGKKKL